MLAEHFKNFMGNCLKASLTTIFKGSWLLIALGLTACGGGGSDSASAPPCTSNAPGLCALLNPGTVNTTVGGLAPTTTAKAEGVYSGTLTGSSSRDFGLLLLENGEFWSTYGIETGNTFLIAGFVQGTGTFRDGTFTSTDGRDFGVTPAARGSITARFSSNEDSFTGTGEVGGRSITVTGARPTASTYDYNAGASLAAITGAWNMRLLDESGVILNIAPSGAFTATNRGCSFSGVIAPRPSGKNVFDVNLTFGGPPCIRPGTTGKGIALTYKIQNSTQRQLFIVGTNPSRTEGTAMFGVR